jgi:tRNA(Ile)-lysidine synthase
MENWTFLHAKLHQILRQRHLLKRNERILIAVSGGQDSLCLTQLLLDLQRKWQWNLAIAHCDHRWPSDRGIATHVRGLASSWQLPFFVKVASEVEETEAAARVWRYQALGEIAQEQGFKVIVTGHTQSDRAETLLYNLIRGAGTDGLSALTWKRSLNANIDLIRPLLTVSRSETLQFCQQAGLAIWEDQVNSNLKYARNRIRQEVIPALKQHFHPQIEEKLAQTAELLRADTDYLNQVAAEYLAKSLDSDQNRLNRLVLRGVALAIQRRVMRLFLAQMLTTAPNFEQVEAMIYLITAPNRSCTSTFPGGAIAEVRDQWILIRTDSTSKEG